MLRGSFHLSLEMMWTELMQLNQPKLHLQQRPKFAAPLKLKEFPTLMCRATFLLVTSYPTCHSLELQLLLETIIILGDGNPKAVFNKEEDIATYTINAVDDPRTLNKILYIRPPANTLSFNELVTLWESKIGKTLERIYVPEEQLLKQIQESSPPANVILSINHSSYVKGDHTNFEIESSFGEEASALYPDVKYTTVDEYLNQFV